MDSSSWCRRDHVTSDQNRTAGHIGSHTKAVFSQRC
jgi:hypothetical protein